MKKSEQLVNRMLGESDDVGEPQDLGAEEGQAPDENAESNIMVMLSPEQVNWLKELVSAQCEEGAEEPCEVALGILSAIDDACAESDGECEDGTEDEGPADPDGFDPAEETDKD